MGCITHIDSITSELDVSALIGGGAMLAAIPIILMYIPLQKCVIDGLTTGSVKG